jgi:hypothetical protein
MLIVAQVVKERPVVKEHGPHSPAIMLHPWPINILTTCFSLLFFKNEKEVYEITTLSVRLFVPH